MGQDSGLPVILITGHGDVPMAVEAMRLGAFNFLEKPFEPEDLTQLIKSAAHKRRLTLESREQEVIILWELPLPDLETIQWQ